MKTILIVRHAQAEGNSEHRFIGQTDVGLTQLGTYQAQLLTRRLVRHPITRVVSSDLRRARQTVEPTAHALGLEVDVDERLREIANGAWAGLLGDEIAAGWPELWERYRQGEDVARPGGESWAQVQARVRGSLEELAAADGGDGVVLVGTHAGPALAAARWAVGLPPEGNVFAGPFAEINNTGVTAVSVPGPRLVSVNDTGHLAGAALT